MDSYETHSTMKLSYMCVRECKNLIKCERKNNLNL